MTMMNEYNSKPYDEYGSKRSEKSHGHVMYESESVVLLSHICSERCLKANRPKKKDEIKCQKKQIACKRSIDVFIYVEEI